MSDQDFLKIRLKFGEAEFEAEGNKVNVEKACGSFLEKLTHSSAVCGPQTVDTSHNGASGHQTTRQGYDYNSFVALKNDLGLSGDTDLVMGAAYYLSFTEKKETFTSIDIKNLFQRTRIKVPGNIPQAITQNIKKGLIEERDKTKADDGRGLKSYVILDGAREWPIKIKDGQ